MAKVPCKGSSISQEIASVFTPIAQLISFDVSGEQSNTYNSTTLDQADDYESFDPTLYTTPAKLAGDMFYDPNLTGHQAFEALVGAPVATNFRVGYVDAGTHTKTYRGTGFGMDKSVAMNDGLKAKFSIQTSGAPS